MRPLLLLPLVLLLTTTVHAQDMPRIGVFHAWSYSENEFLFNGVAEYTDHYRAPALGLLFEQPLGDGFFLTLQPWLSKLTGGEVFWYDGMSETGPIWEHMWINEVWVVELPISLKKEFVFGRWSPYASAGLLLSLTTPPDKIYFKSAASDILEPQQEAFVPSSNVGITASVGTELRVSEVLGISLEAAWLQLFNRHIDAPFLIQENTPRFHIRTGVVFHLSAEDWK